MKLTLASSSKQKSEILNKVGLKHYSLKPDVEEISDKANIYEYTMEIANQKALAVSTKVSDGIIIGIDTVVDINGKIAEKPKSLEEAKDNLRKASNQVTRVITGISIINLDTEEKVTTFQESKVKMKNISEEELDFYIENENDVMYASGYIIETIASCYLEKIEGSFYNILGVPVEKIYEIIKEQGYTLKDFECTGL